MKSLKTLSGDSLEQMIDYKVVDQNGDEIGTLHSLWSDPDTGSVEFLGVKTGWLFGHNHVVPADKAELDESANLVRLPYAAAFIKEAPSMAAESEISEAEEQDIFRYYGMSRSDSETADSTAAPVESPADAARWRRTSRPEATTTGESTSMSAASVSPDTTRDQLPSSSTPSATYPTANLYGSTGSSSIPTAVATPATTGTPADTCTTGPAGRGLDTAAGTDPGMDETKSVDR